MEQSVEPHLSLQQEPPLDSLWPGMAGTIQPKTPTFAASLQDLPAHRGWEGIDEPEVVRALDSSGLHRLSGSGNSDWLALDADWPACACSFSPSLVAPAALLPLSGDVRVVEAPARSPGPDSTGASESQEGEIAALVCSYTWDCAKALRVFRCESGDDLIAGFESGHAGTAQIAPVHAWRFEQHGWDYWQDGADPVKNIAIAYEIFTEQAWVPWPICGLQ